jgi:hypothetical protein
MAQTTYLFPKETIECDQGDYIISKTKGEKWKVFHIEDLVLLSRLVPLQFAQGIELIEEKDMLDSKSPSRMGEIHLLLTLFDREFVTSNEAVEAIKSGTLGQSTPDVCLSISHFRRDTSKVYKDENR